MRIFFVAILSLALLSAQDAIFRASTELVVVDALVENRRTGNPIRSLTRDDFEIYEDRARQSISQLSLDKAPLSILFLIDMTDSVRPVLKPLAEGAIGALKHLKPEDEIGVMLYSGRAELVQDFTLDHDAVARAIESAGTMRPGHCGSKPELCNLPAYFNEGVFQAATSVHRTNRTTHADYRPVVIWLTDNVPNVPDEKVHTEVEAIGLVRETGVVICTLMEKSAMSYEMGALYAHNPLFGFARRGHPPGDVYRYADESGGIVTGASRKDMAEKLAALIDRLRSRYTIGYTPLESKPEGVACHINVKLTKEAIARLREDEGVRAGDIVIHARKSYQR